LEKEQQNTQCRSFGKGTAEIENAVPLKKGTSKIKNVVPLEKEQQNTQMMFL